MDEFETALAKLKQALLDSPEAQLFFSLRNNILTDPFLVDLDTRKRHAQQEMAMAMGDDHSYAKWKKEYLSLSEAYDEHPLVANYEEARQALKDRLGQIEAILDTAR